MTSGIDMQNNLDTSSDPAWLLARCALGELTPAQQTQLEDLLLHDEQLCQQLADTTELLLTLRHTPPAQAMTPPASPTTTVFRRGSRSRALVTVTTVAALSALGLVCTAVRSGLPEQLSDAVTLSSLLQSENSELRTADSDPWTPADDLPEPPDWLLTALDLDEQSGEDGKHTADDEEEALF
ncbi:MAG: hypothetical protein ACKPJD_10050 [Planctomycetaceae bacterium]